MNAKYGISACMLALMSGCASLPSSASAADSGLNIKVASDSDSTQSKVPVTFGQVFRKGDVPGDASVGARLADGTVVPLQVDRKATHADGSLRHAVLTLELPRLDAHDSAAVELYRGRSPSDGKAVSRQSLLATDFDTQVRLNMAGKTYTASARAALTSGSGKQWLSGPLASEWILSQPLRNGSGSAHPYLMAYFHVRAYAEANGDIARAKIDVIVENNWTFVSNPRNFNYDVSVTVGGQSVYSTDGLEHHAHARWRKTFWWGESADVHVKPDTGYVIASRAVASYSQNASDRPTQARLAQWENKLSAADTGPMGLGLITPRFASNAEAAIADSEAVDYLLTGDRRAFKAMIINSQAAGSLGIHYRDKDTGRVPSIAETRDITIKHDVAGTAIPKGGDDGAAPDTSHQDDFAYIAYLTTGDYYHLEELLFWTNWNELEQNPAYRQHEKGLFKSEQVRAQAWDMRTLANAAYITPDEHPQKMYFTKLLQNNIGWYTDEYVGGPKDNAFHAMTENFVFSYGEGRSLPPWMDDWFTSVIGYMVNMGYTEAQPLQEWKGEFPVERMTNPNYCWIEGAAYQLYVRDSDSSPLYTSYGKAYKETSDVSDLQCNSSAMARALDQSVGEMTGFAHSGNGYPARMKGALATAVDAGVSGAQRAWDIYSSRSVKPDWGRSGKRGSNRYNIVPFEPAPSEQVVSLQPADPQEIQPPGGLCIEYGEKRCEP